MIDGRGNILPHVKKAATWANCPGSAHIQGWPARRAGFAGEPCPAGSREDLARGASRGCTAAGPLCGQCAQRREDGAQRRNQTARARGAAGAHGTRQGPEAAQRSGADAEPAARQGAGHARNDRDVGAGPGSAPLCPPDKIPHKAPAGRDGEKGGRSRRRRRGEKGQAAAATRTRRTGGATEAAAPAHEGAGAAGARPPDRRSCWKRAAECTAGQNATPARRRGATLRATCAAQPGRRRAAIKALIPHAIDHIPYLSTR